MTMILTVHEAAGPIDRELAAAGIEVRGHVFRNLSVPELYEHALRRDEGVIAADGQFVVDTGKHTGRSPNDKFFVREPGSETHIDWTANKAITPATFDALLSRVGEYLRGKDLFALDCYVGADPRYCLPVRILTQFAWHSLFCRDLFIDTADNDEA